MMQKQSWNFARKKSSYQDYCCDIPRGRGFVELNALWAWPEMTSKVNMKGGATHNSKVKPKLAALQPQKPWTRSLMGLSREAYGTQLFSLLKKPRSDSTKKEGFSTTCQVAQSKASGRPKVWSMNHVSRQLHYVIRTLYCACVRNNMHAATSYLGVLRVPRIHRAEWCAWSSKVACGLKVRTSCYS